MDHRTNPKAYLNEQVEAATFTSAANSIHIRTCTVCVCVVSVCVVCVMCVMCVVCVCGEMYPFAQMYV